MTMQTLEPDIKRMFNADESAWSVEWNKAIDRLVELGLLKELGTIMLTDVYDCVQRAGETWTDQRGDALKGLWSVIGAEVKRQCKQAEEPVGFEGTMREIIREEFAVIREEVEGLKLRFTSQRVSPWEGISQLAPTRTTEQGDEFRKRLHRYYFGSSSPRCMITRYTQKECEREKSFLVSSHIYPYAGLNRSECTKLSSLAPHVDFWSPRNGLVLCKELEREFDIGYFSFIRSLTGLTVHVFNTVSMAGAWGIHGKPLTYPVRNSRPSGRLLAAHLEYCFHKAQANGWANTLTIADIELVKALSETASRD